MRLISFVVRHARRTFALALLAGVLSGAANVAFLAVINRALRGGSAAEALLWGFAGLCLALPVTRFISESLLARFGQGALFDLRMQLGRQVLATPLSHLEGIGPHKLLAAFTDDLVAITNALLIIPVISINVAVVLCALFYMGWLSGWLLLMVLVFMVLGILTYHFPMVKAQDYLRLAREDSNQLLNHLRALTDGAKELKLHYRRRAAFLEDIFSTTASSFRRHNVTGLTIYTAAASWGQVLVFIVIGLVLFALPLWRPMSVETLTGYCLALLYMMSPLQVIINLMPGIGRANIALKKIDELRLSLAAQPADVSAAAPPPPAASWGPIELAGVTHSYRREGEESSFVLGPIDLTLRQGELVFLVGGNGSGKTTLSKLLVGLYTPESGEVSFGGEPVTDERREGYREHFSVVFSDFYLFESLVGLDDPRLDARAREYLTLLNLDRKVEIKNGVLSTTSLSQGQRKRLALLTAYLEDRPVYLFDEWAADQDPHFKEVFYLKLLPELKARGKTVVVISHDDRYFHVADRLVKLEYGRVVEQTSYEKIIPFANEGTRYAVSGAASGDGEGR
jgi:putative ATP-binding cassette transporter